MDTTADVTISTQQKLENLSVAVESVYQELRHEGRYVAAVQLETALVLLRAARRFHEYRTPGHD